eukprot:CAMPEP_0169150216 /NCGR_PEP_ID=MMETSP1015-20121227/50028_1 /TAXON_ID=342587 /ORGANISM="Karlodinium micrum, Strain CCMP2283" /LENGTH=108 /DNA_ID=CAMNT_0009219261 /DNA_START=220 /DNA_END=547 /DNA_ORIENTATION=-
MEPEDGQAMPSTSARSSASDDATSLMLAQDMRGANVSGGVKHGSALRSVPRCAHPQNLRDSTEAKKTLSAMLETCPLRSSHDAEMECESDMEMDAFHNLSMSSEMEYE